MPNRENNVSRTASIRKHVGKLGNTVSGTKMFMNLLGNISERPEFCARIDIFRAIEKVERFSTLLLYNLGENDAPRAKFRLVENRLKFPEVDEQGNIDRN